MLLIGSTIFTALIFMWVSKREDYYYSVYLKRGLKPQVAHEKAHFRARVPIWITWWIILIVCSPLIIAAFAGIISAFGLIDLDQARAISNLGYMIWGG